jgi:hypothetical protein
MVSNHTRTHPRRKTPEEKKRARCDFLSKFFTPQVKATVIKKKRKKNASFSICHLPSPTFDLFYFLGVVAAGFPCLPGGLRSAAPAAAGPGDWRNLSFRRVRF